MSDPIHRPALPIGETRYYALREHNTEHLASGALFDTEDQQHRYALWRIWNTASYGWCTFIGLNPSTADEREDDPTIRRCIGFALRWGYGGIVMLNAFSFRATDPIRLRLADNPSGDPIHRRILRHYAMLGSNIGGIVVAAWGVHGALDLRGDAVAQDLREAGVTLYCFGTTRDGYPKHPLYLSNTTKLREF